MTFEAPLNLQSSLGNSLSGSCPLLGVIRVTLAATHQRLSLCTTVSVCLSWSAASGTNCQHHLRRVINRSSRSLSLEHSLTCKFWLFAQKPFDPQNHPKPPQTPNFPENPALPRNPPGIPTEFILSAIQSPTEFH